jgi:hypothetical protein
MRLPILCLAAALLLAGPAAAAPSAADLQGALAGAWKGALGYRDYQDNKLYELPVQTQVTAIGDGVSVLRISTFDDGPSVGAVRITSASLFDPAAGTVTSATLRKGRPVEVSTEAVRLSAYRDPVHWTLVYERNGPDGDGEARIRITETRDGDSLMSVKEVRALTPTDAPWAFRNQTRLTRDSGQGSRP